MAGAGLVGEGELGGRFLETCNEIPKSEIVADWGCPLSSLVIIPRASRIGMIRDPQFES